MLFESILDIGLYFLGFSFLFCILLGFNFREETKQKLIKIYMYLCIILSIILVMAMMITYPVIFLILVSFLTISAIMAYLLFFMPAKMAKKHVIFQKLNEDDFRKEKQYYRDILYHYSAALLSFVDNFEINFPRDLIGDLLILEKDNYISVDSNGIFLNRLKKDDSKISEIQKYIVNHINYGFLTINTSHIRDIVVKEGLEKKVIQKIIIKNNSIFGKFFDLLVNSNLSLYLLGFMTFVLLLIGILNNQKSFIIVAILALVLLIFSFILIPKMIYDNAISKENSENPYFRTAQGINLNKKLEGLKQYLQDYSDMKNKTAEDIVLWDEYLIYSIIFHQNNNTLAKYSKYIKIVRN